VAGMNPSGGVVGRSRAMLVIGRDYLMRGQPRFPKIG